MLNKRKKFSKIFDQQINKIYRFIYLKVSSAEIAQDLSSETFLRGWKAYNKTKNEIENPQAFLYQIARNLVIDFYRKREKTKTISIEEYLETDNFNVNNITNSIEEKIMLVSDIDSIKTALGKLKDDYQNVIIWHYLDDLSISETAKLLDKTEENTRVLLHRALKALREKLV